MGLAQVLVVEDDPFSATSLEAALILAGFEVTGAAQTAKEALGALEKKPTDVAVLDIDLGPGPTGIDVAYALRQVNPVIGLVFLTSFTDPRLSKSGNLPLPKGSRYITKSALKDLKTLGSLILQAKYQPLSTAGLSKAPSTLTPQQIEVLRLIASGATNTEIARQLVISEKAVEHLVGRIAKVLKIKRSTNQNLRVQLVRVYSDLTGKSLPSI